MGNAAAARSSGAAHISDPEPAERYPQECSAESEMRPVGTESRRGRESVSPMRRLPTAGFCVEHMGY